jgi:methyl-accepting chemotaxis protein
MRWKLLTAFTAAFTIVFGFIALWVVNYASDVALSRLTSQLVEATEGTARDLPRKALREVTTLDPNSDFADNAAYVRIQDDLDSVRATLPSVDPYTYFHNAGRLEFLVGTAPTFGQPVSQTEPDETIDFLEKGLRATTFQPEYTDAFGTWISAYSPVVDNAGNTIAAVGMDYPLDYVTQVQREARGEVVPILIVSYVFLVVLVLVVSTLIVRPLRRLTAATTRIADGEYDLDLSGLTRSRFPDEMSELADSFKVMSGKVAAREQALSSEVQRLQIAIDAREREESVREITETDFFADLAAKADEMRSRMHKK